MIDQNLQQTIRGEIESYMTQKQFNLSKIQSHVHNGTDTSRISEKDLIIGDKIRTFLILDTSETLTIARVANISSMTFMGFIANNANGSPASNRAVINGQAEFGPCFGFGGTGSYVSYDNHIPIPFIQSSNSMFTGSAGTRVASSNLYFCYAVDTSGEICKVEILSADKTTITMKATLGSNYKLQGALILK